MYILYLITPTLGLLRNYSKYKQCNFKIFMRTPITYCLFHFLICLWGTKNIILKTLIAERWFFLYYKSLKSIINNDYKKNKEKYIKKYGLIYD